MNANTLKEGKKREAEREAQILHALAGRKKQHADLRRDKKQKKKPVDELLTRLAIKGMHRHVLRPADDYVPRSYNLDKQLLGLINHLFVQYPAPYFMYQVCLAETAVPKGGQDRFAGRGDVYRKWFVTLAQGGSFRKLTQSFMTSKEASAFLAAPWNRQIHENVWWAKMKVAGVPETLIGTLIDRIFTNHSFDDPDGRLAEAVLFYARQHPALDKTSFDGVTDFLAWKLRFDPAFRLKGRTAASVVRLSEEWHLQMQRAKLGRHVRWEGLGIPDWEYEAKDVVWEVLELRDNKELVNEGRKQKHCVYSYVSRCVEGRCAIFSLRAYRKFAARYQDDGKPVWDRTYETRRITIEVSSARVVMQVRGVLNGAPVKEERDILRLWTGEKGLRMAEGL